MSNGAEGVESTVIGGRSIIIDAKQRAIIAQYHDDRASVAVCAEPSPDAVAALSTALSGSLGGNIFGNSEAEAAFSAAFSEAVGQLGKRNATIQLLRDALYRQCEAYANGAIKNSEYSSASRRYIDAMVALLAIEQLTNGHESPLARDMSDQAGATTANSSTFERQLDGLKTPDGETLESASRTATESSAASEAAGPAETEAGALPKGTGAATASAEAANPVVPGSNSALVGSPSDRVAIEVRTMVEAFFRKGIVSECLALFQTPPEFANRTFHDPVLERAYVDYLEARNHIYDQCSDIIAAAAKSAKVQAEQAEAIMSRLSNDDPLEYPKLLLQQPTLY